MRASTKKTIFKLYKCIMTLENRSINKKGIHEVLILLPWSSLIVILANVITRAYIFMPGNRRYIDRYIDR